MAQASNLSSADLRLLRSIANSSVPKIDNKKGHAHVPHNCSSPCKFVLHNATTGGNCHTLFKTTPTCLYLPLSTCSDRLVNV